MSHRLGGRQAYRNNPLSYDAEGREIHRITVGSDGSRSVERRVQYNLFGEVTAVAPAVRVGRSMPNTTMSPRDQEQCRRRVTHAYMYDKNGNATMRMESQASDLRPLTLQQILELQDVFVTYTIYDARNQAIEVVTAHDGADGRAPEGQCRVDSAGAGAVSWNCC